MGTRAVIRYNGKDFLATHWDGYPESLGVDLAKLPTKSKRAILIIAKKHQIDAGSSEVHTELTKERFEMLSKKHKLSISEIKKGKRRGNIISAEDYPIGSISNYGDWAEYIYDIRGDVVYVAEGHGDYDATKRAEKEGRLKWKRYVGGKTGQLTKPLTKKEKGWFYESARHAMSAKGLKSGRKKKGYHGSKLVKGKWVKMKNPEKEFNKIADLIEKRQKGRRIKR